MKITSLDPLKIPRSHRACRLGFATLALAAAVAWPLPMANAALTGPYTADANTTFLFHFDEAAGASSTVNTGVFSNGTNAGNAISYNQNLYPGGGGGTTPGVATVSTAILGATAYSGFGNAANVNPAGLTSNTLNGNGLGFDFNNNAAFNISRTTTPAGDAMPLSANIFDSTTKAFTLEAMIQTSTATVTAAGQEIISTDSTNTLTGRGFQFRLATTGLLEFNDVGGTFQAFSSIAVTDASLGANAWNATDWFHVAITYDGTNVSFYWTKVDPANTSANLLGTALPFDATGLDITDSGPLVFGNEARFSSTGAAFSNDGLLGSIDEARISTVARTADQFIFTAVPEPSVLGLGLAAGLAFFGISRLRRPSAI